MMSLARHGCRWLPAFVVLCTIAIPTAAADTPFEGAVAADQINVYAGASTNYYVVTTLRRGAIVSVNDNLYGWYKIDPPAGTHSLIAKEFVADNGDGTGTVRGSKVRVKAPAPTGPDDSYRTQTLADEGMIVNIVGEDGAYYRIAPPTGVQLFVQARDVAAATPAQIAAARAERRAAATPITAAANDAPAPAEPPAQSDAPTPLLAAAATAPEPAANDTVDGADADETAELARALDEIATRSDEAEQQPIDQTAAAEAPAPQATAEPIEITTATDEEAIAQAAPAIDPAQPVAAIDQAVAEPPVAAITLDSIDTSAIADTRLPIQPNHGPLRELEKKLIAVGELDLIDRPLGTLRMGYERLASTTGLSDRDKALIDARILQLKHQQQLQGTLIEITVTREGLAEAARRRAEREAAAPRQYLAVGRLTASALYDGKRLPQLYRVSNPMNGLTIAYVRQTEGGPDLRQMLGSYVGVTGTRESNPGLKIDFINPTAVDELTPQTASASR